MHMNPFSAARASPNLANRNSSVSLVSRLSSRNENLGENHFTGH